MGHLWPPVPAHPPRHPRSPPCRPASNRMLLVLPCSGPERKECLPPHHQLLTLEIISSGFVARITSAIFCHVSGTIGPSIATPFPSKASLPSGGSSLGDHIDKE